MERLAKVLPTQFASLTITASEGKMADTAISGTLGFYQCNSCEAKKPADEFYASNLSSCKECVKAKVRRNRAKKADYYRAYDRKRYRDSPDRKENARKSANSPAGMISRARYAEKIKIENPEKLKARRAISNGIRDGKIERGTACHFCASSHNLQAHHEDYDHPLDVVWLCAKCHGKLHGIRGDFRRAS